MKPSGSILSNVATGVLVVCAVAITALVARREFFMAPPASGAVTELRQLDRWSHLAETGARMGPADAPVVIVEFSDFQCRFCAVVQTALAAIRTRYPERVAVVYRHFPLDAIHPHARAAANAAECAGEQGRFEAYHDALFAAQDSIGRTPWERFAEITAVADLDAFRRCIEENRYGVRVEQDAQLAAQLGLEATPTLIVNGVVYTGAPSEAELERLVLAAAP
jgi:protein-disulfide isomerase